MAVGFGTSATHAQADIVLLRGIVPAEKPVDKALKHVLAF
jgi:hypothetical protein